MLVVFDLDGTLVDSRRDLADSANQLLSEYGAPPLDEASVGHMVGSGAAVLVARACAAAGIDPAPGDALGRFLEIYDRVLLNHTRPYRDIPHVLDRLCEERASLALLTNKPLAASIRILEAFDLAKYFPNRVGGDGPWPRKPVPDGMRWLMEQAGAGEDETLLVGDSIIDLRTSRNAGVPICLARYGFGFVDVPADALRGDEGFADSPSEILNAVYRLKGSS